MNSSQANVILCGGPMSERPENERLTTVGDVSQVLKLPMGSHYEHFGPTPEQRTVDGRPLVVFAWSHRTYVAE